MTTKKYKIEHQKDFGAMLKQIRLENNFTQDEVAEASGTTKSNISAIENGKNITTSTFLNYLNVFNCDIEIDVTCKAKD